MGWVCTKDGKSNADDLTECPVCGAARPCRVALAGAAGKIELRLGADIGAALLAEVIGDESKYCANPQYRISCDEDNHWRATLCSETTANLTVVNGSPIPTDGVSLKTGDVIAVMSRTDTAKTAAAVTVELLPI